MAEHDQHAQHGGHGHDENGPVDAEYHERIFANFIRISAWNVLLIFIILAMLALSQT